MGLLRFLGSGLIAVCVGLAVPGGTVWAAPPPIPAATTEFLSAIDDVPLPAGLHEQPDSIVEIDGPEGRIISVQARGVISPAALTGYYDSALPALGWRRDGTVFLRQRAKLSIRFKRTGEDLTVTFSLVERPASLRLE